MKLTDVLANLLQRYGIERVHGVTGGAVVHIFDSAKSAGIQPIFYQNEQAASFGAVGEIKRTKKLACCVVTTGPGGTNAITGVASAWVDSLPLLVISGQARIEHLSSRKKVRQLGTQEINIVSIVGSITKWAGTIHRPDDFITTLEEVVAIAHEGRPGPVWIDLPLDFQWANIGPLPVTPFNHSSAGPYLGANKENLKGAECQKLMLDECTFDNYLEDLRKSRRPAFLIGGGVTPEYKKKLTAWLKRNECPYTLTYNSLELTEGRNDAMNFGIVGIAGRRDANALIHNADNLTIIGTHLPLPLTGALTSQWCSEAKKTLVNIDQHELNVSRFKFAHKFCVDSRQFIDALCSRGNLEVSSDWTDFCEKISRIKEPTRIPPTPYVDQYHFLRALSDNLRPTDVVIVDGGGTINASAFTTIRPYETTSIVMSSGICSMGSGIPEAIGASSVQTSPAERHILLIGDGSLQFNVQELATIYACGLSLKIFVMCNEGYSSIRITQKQFLENRFLGVSESTGIFLPAVADLASTYRMEYFTLKSPQNICHEINKILESDGPALIEVLIDPNQLISPTQGFRSNKDGTFSPSPLHSMNPALSTEDEMLLTKWISK
jgi:acetolactate synthase-1/2/3 large subunit